MEILAGKKVPYIKPIRLYTIVVVLHFIIFSFAGSGDLFSVDQFPVVKMVPEIHQMIVSYEIKAGLAPEELKDVLNAKIKDNLNIIFYFIPFFLAFFFKLLYSRSRKYYTEHLCFVLHLITFGLIRNIILVPLLIMDWFAVAMVISLVTQLTYGYVATKLVYGESTTMTALKFFLVTVGFVAIFMPGWFLALVIGLAQVTN